MRGVLDWGGEGGDWEGGEGWTKGEGEEWAGTGKRTPQRGEKQHTGEHQVWSFLAGRDWVFCQQTGCTLKKAARNTKHIPVRPDAQLHKPGYHKIPPAFIKTVDFCLNPPLSHPPFFFSAYNCTNSALKE